MIRLSVDDGCASDVRVAELAEKYGIETTFYWPVEWQSLAIYNGYTPLTYEEALGIADKFEVGSHTITHRHLTRMDRGEAKQEIRESRTMLRALFRNQSITKFCPPRGYTDEHLTAYTMQFYQSQRLTKGAGLLHVHPDSGANGGLDWLRYAAENEITEAWCHSWELDKYNLWEELEEFLKEQSRA